MNTGSSLAKVSFAKEKFNVEKICAIWKSGKINEDERHRGLTRLDFASVVRRFWQIANRVD
jgi:hypothetical protein